jgi:hypothetical protein
VLLIALGIAGRAPPIDRDPLRVVRAGAPAALLTLLAASVTFPTFNTLAITPITGLLIAICASAGRLTNGDPHSRPATSAPQG